MYLNGHTPRKDFEQIYVAPNSAVIGDVDLMDDNTLFYGVVIRGDRNSVHVSASWSNHVAQILVKGRVFHCASHLLRF